MTATCPDAGRLRAWLERGGASTGAGPTATASAGSPPGFDGGPPTAPAGPRSLGDPPTDIDEHLPICAACRAAIDALAHDAEAAARALDLLASPLPTALDAERALARLHRRLDSASPAAALPAAHASSIGLDDVPGVSDRAPAIHSAGDLVTAAPREALTVSHRASAGPDRVNGGVAARPRDEPAGEHRDAARPRLALDAPSIADAPAAARAPAAAHAPSIAHAPAAARTSPTSDAPSGAPSWRPRMSRALPWQRWRLAFGGVAAAVALTLLLLTPEGQAVAAGFLAQFRSQRLAIVTFDPNQARQTGLLPLERLGTLKNAGPSAGQRSVELASVQEAAGRAGFPVLQPDPATLPAGVSRTPRIRFSPSTETRLTFDRQKAREYFDAQNRRDLSLPDRLHGSTLVVALPPVVMLEYAAADGKPGLMIGEAREVHIGVEGGASLDEVREFLLGLPGLPPELARQLRAIQDWRSTLPIPVPVDKISWQDTTINGAPAFLLNDNTGLGSAVIWQRDGRIVGVAGPARATDLRRVAESLR